MSDAKIVQAAVSRIRACLQQRKIVYDQELADALAAEKWHVLALLDGCSQGVSNALAHVEETVSNATDIETLTGLAIRLRDKSEERARERSLAVIQRRYGAAATYEGHSVGWAAASFFVQQELELLRAVVAA